MLDINKIHHGHVMDLLEKLPDRSINLTITSPPYYRQRLFGTVAVWGGDKNCDHDFTIHTGRSLSGGGNMRQYEKSSFTAADSWTCSKCSAWKGELGHEPDPLQFVKHIADIAKELFRVTTPDGSFFMNMGDSYWSGNKLYPWLYRNQKLLIPARCAIAIQELGWIVRNDIIWDKLFRPESVKSRFSHQHEMLFFFTKSRKNYFDIDSIRVPHNEVSLQRMKYDKSYNRKGGNGYENFDYSKACHPKGKNPGDVWKILARGNASGHIAPFPEELCHNPIKAACPPDGTVLDPFCGSGTVLKVANDLMFNWIGFDLDPESVHSSEASMYQEIKFQRQT